MELQDSRTSLKRDFLGLTTGVFMTGNAQSSSSAISDNKDVDESLDLVL
jgi:hypothetical protein